MNQSPIVLFFRLTLPFLLTKIFSESLRVLELLHFRFAKYSFKGIRKNGSMRGVPNFPLRFFGQSLTFFLGFLHCKSARGKHRSSLIPLHKGKKLRVSQLISKRTKTQHILFYEASPNP
ncbi:hypothetical protein DLM78_06215 [Leptospira stimsonii]|uniref:Uncharacterized protein n=1 Tax=Leptospira stimsonii TaxID=2202203 RepID=A0A8B3CV20_9LEPT|nr:hypothetical protein DLM78_06215 [Leptospira stimsonii]